jgi:flavin-binding protein dodecin
MGGRYLVVVLLAAAGCAGQQAGPSEQTTAVSSGGEGLRSPEAVSQALDRAQDAYMNGRWGEAVTSATQVIEGAASPDEYYLAVKILGLASCARKDPRPVSFAWSRLLPADRASLRNECAQHDLSISDEGVVTPK